MTTKKPTPKPTPDERHGSLLVKDDVAHVVIENGRVISRTENGKPVLSVCACCGNTKHPPAPCACCGN